MAERANDPNFDKNNDDWDAYISRDEDEEMNDGMDEEVGDMTTVKGIDSDDEDDDMIDSDDDFDDLDMGDDLDDDDEKEESFDDDDDFDDYDDDDDYEEDDD